MTFKSGDIRYLAEWLARWEPREDGEFYVDDQVYNTRICESKEEAAQIAIINDDCGVVLIQEYQHKDFGLYDWFTIDEILACKVAKL